MILNSNNVAEKTSARDGRDDGPAMGAGPVRWGGAARGEARTLCSTKVKSVGKMRTINDPILVVALLLAPLLPGPSHGGAETARMSPSSWPDTFVARVEALALLETLNAELLSHDSATLTLERWCAAHRLALPARIVAARVAGVDAPASPEQRADLQVSATEPIRYRRVRLLCGAVVLSEADNWYVPGRLAPGMNRLLDSTDTPFGKVVEALHFRRRTLSATLLWSPLPEAWEMGELRPDGKGSVLEMPPQLLRHRALLSVPDGTPFSEVVETYTANVLAFPPPKLP
jgi:chorismate-pyruvate lyase